MYFLSTRQGTYMAFSAKPTNFRRFFDIQYVIIEVNTYGIRFINTELNSVNQLAFYYLLMF